MSVTGAATESGAYFSDDAGVHSSVADFYGKVLSSNKELKTSACTAASKPSKAVRDALKLVPKAVTEKFYGCGNPIPPGISGLRILDLGCGTGRDCFVAAQFVGPQGSVTGVDMSTEQLATANAALPAFLQAAPHATKNIRFFQGYIEDLEGSGIARDSVDIIISNCVVNLSPRKEDVLRSAFNSLAMGGEFYFSDVYCDRRLPIDVRKHELLFGECISGALYINDFIAMCKKIGFADPRRLSTSPIQVSDPELREVLGGAKFFSITYRLFKLPALEPNCEDYGQIAWYLGTVPSMSQAYQLDDHHVFEKDRPVLVCGNTASMLQDSWLRPYFRLHGDRQTHFGEFPCGGTATCATAGGNDEPGDCSAKGACCSIARDNKSYF